MIGKHRPPGGDTGIQTKHIVVSSLCSIAACCTQRLHLFFVFVFVFGPFSEDVNNSPVDQAEK